MDLLSVVYTFAVKKCDSQSLTIWCETNKLQLFVPLRITITSNGCSFRYFFTFNCSNYGLLVTRVTKYLTVKKNASGNEALKSISDQMSYFLSQRFCTGSISPPWIPFVTVENHYIENQNRPNNPHSMLLIKDASKLGPKVRLKKTDRYWYASFNQWQENCALHLRS